MSRWCCSRGIPVSVDGKASLWKLTLPTLTTDWWKDYNHQSGGVGGAGIQVEIDRATGRLYGFGPLAGSIRGKGYYGVPGLPGQIWANTTLSGTIGAVIAETIAEDGDVVWVFSAFGIDRVSTLDGSIVNSHHPGVGGPNPVLGGFGIAGSGNVIWASSTGPSVKLWNSSLTEVTSVAMASNNIAPVSSEGSYCPTISEIVVKSGTTYSRLDTSLSAVATGSGSDTVTAANSTYTLVRSSTQWKLLDSSFAELWAVNMTAGYVFQATGGGGWRSACIDASGNVYVIEVKTTATVDMLVRKLSAASGAELWATSVGESVTTGGPNHILYDADTDAVVLMDGVSPLSGTYYAVFAIDGSTGTIVGKHRLGRPGSSSINAGLSYKGAIWDGALYVTSVQGNPSIS